MRIHPLSETHHQVIVASILERDGRFLLIEEPVNGTLKLNQPAGRLEVGETLLQGAIRETREESGYTFIPSHIVGVYDYFHVPTGVLFLRVAYSGAVVAMDGVTRPSDPHIHAVHWLTYEELAQSRDRHRSPFVMRCVEDHLAGKAYPLDLITHFPASPVF